MGLVGDYVSVPRDLWEDDRLTLYEKHIMSKVRELHGIGGCFASNRAFAEFLRVSRGYVSKIISALDEKGYIEIVMERGEKNQVKRRTITPRGGGSCGNQVVPVGTRVVPVGTRVVPAGTGGGSCGVQSMTTPNDSVNDSDKEGADPLSINGDRSPIRKAKKPKRAYGESVRLTDKQHARLVEQYGEKTLHEYIRKVNNYAPNRKAPYKDYAAAIRTFAERDGVKPKDEKDADRYTTCERGHRYLKAVGYCQECYAEDAKLEEEPTDD